MTPRKIRYVLEVGGREILARTVRGREALSEPAMFQFAAIIPVREELETDDIAGASCSLSIVADGSAVRAITLVAVSASRGASAARDPVGVPFEVELASPIALAQHRVDIRIFRDVDVPTIVEKVLSTFGIAVERRLASSYAIRPYTVQWRESDLAFVARLLEDEGIFYKTKDDGGIVLGDSPAAYEPEAALSFVPGGALEAPREAVIRGGWRGAMTASSITMRDFDFERPKLDVVGASAVRARASAGGGEWYDYPAARLDPGAAATKAKLTAEAFSAAQHHLAGAATRLALAPAHALELRGLPSGLRDGRYAVVAATHDWSADTNTFHVGFEALDANDTFRPMPLTPRPSLVGVTVGTVTGMPGEDIHTDEWGRAKVHFHWDRLQPKDANCSDWIPTLQDNTGHSIGIPRVGWEMLVQHLEGDPDRPVILGRTYTPEDDFYSHLPTNKMMTTLRSLTSPRSNDGTTGENYVAFLDLKGYERLHFQAERDQEVLTEHDKTEHTLVRDSREVDGHEKVRVGRSRTHEVAQTIFASVGTNQDVTIGHDRKLQVGGRIAESVTSNRSLSIGGSHTRRFETMDVLQAQHDLTETIGAVDVELSPQGNQATTQIAEAVLVGGALVEIAKQAVSQNAQKLHAEVVGALLHQQAKENIGLRASKKRSTTVGGNYTATAGKSVLLSGVESLKMTVGELVLSAKKKLTLKVGETTLVMDADRHAIEAPETITAHADARNDLNAAKSGQNDRTGG